MKIAVGGPPGAGKTTLSYILSDLLDLSLFSLDECRKSLYPLWGYSADIAESIFQKGGVLALHQYETEYELKALEHSLAFEESLVIDLSGGVLIQKGEENQRRLTSALEEIDLLLLVLPTRTGSPKALQILESRITKRDNGDRLVLQWLAFGGKEFLKQMVKATLDCSEHFGALCIDTEQILEDTILDILRFHLL